MNERQHCPFIPLKRFRGNELFDFLNNLLLQNPGIHIHEIYNHVLNHFGEENCLPEILCPHYTTVHPEFWHVTRLTLWDGSNNGIFNSDKRGHWDII